MAQSNDKKKNPAGPADKPLPPVRIEQLWEGDLEEIAGGCPTDSSPMCEVGTCMNTSFAGCTRKLQ